MTDSSSRPTDADAQSLIQKLIDFDASLSSGEQALFRTRLQAAMAGVDEVEGHAMELNWQWSAQGLIHTWVYVDDQNDFGRATIEPARWDTLSARSAVSQASQGKPSTAESQA